MSFSIQTFSQVDTVEKIVFVYKNVQGHEIIANIFLPSVKEKHSVLIYFHGGGFIFANRDQGLDNVLKDKLLSNNYAAVSTDYRLAPETKLDEILNDVSDIVKWIKKNGEEKFNLDSSKIMVIGGSSGGYWALSAGFDKIFAPKAIIAISSPSGFSTANIQMGDLGQATAFYNFLQENGVYSKLYLVENGHSSELIKQNPDVVDEIIKFLNEQLNR